MGDADRGGGEFPRAQMRTEPAHPADTTVAVPGRAHFACFDGLRAIAATLIVVHHAGFASAQSINGAFGELWAHADAGVPIFFLISGFLLYRPFIVHHLDASPPQRMWSFWWNRILRIVPAFWVALIGIYAFFGFPKGDLNSVTSVVTYFGFLQIYSPTLFNRAISQAWSLGTEMTFYLFVPLYAWTIRRIARRWVDRRLRIEIIGVAALAVLSVAWKLALFAADPYWTRLAELRPDSPAPRAFLAANYWLPSYLDLFALGMGLAIVSVWASRQPVVPRVVATVGRHPGVCWLLAALTYWIVCFQAGLPRDLSVLTGRQLLLRQFLYGLTALFLVVPAVVGDQDRGAVRGFLRWRPIAFVGLVSYGVYLWHQAWLGKVAEWFSWGDFRGHMLERLVLAFALTVATATASYFVVERPALRLKRLARRRRRPAGGAPV